jgi:predicted porin
MKYVLAAAFVLSAGAAQAGGPVTIADDPGVAPPAEVAAGFDWTGFYAGLSLSKGTADDGTEFDTSGFGLQVGYLRDFGAAVVGGELEYSATDLDDFPTSIDTTRLKLIGGYGAGRFLPYAFVGVSDIKVSNGGTSISDSTTNYGLGARYAFGAEGRFVAGLEYIVENKDRFGGAFETLESDAVSLRLDYRF